MVKQVENDTKGRDTFDLAISDPIDDTPYAQTDEPVGDGGEIGTTTLGIGTYKVSEAAAGNASLDDYASSVECVDANDNDSVVASTDGNGNSLEVNVTDGSDITCTVTNTRKTGQLNVVKRTVNDTTGGTFNLLVVDPLDNTPYAQTSSPVSNGGQIGTTTLGAGFYKVVETAATGTSLEAYNTAIECRNANAGNAVVASTNPWGRSLRVHVTDGSSITCTVTNTYLSRALRVIKRVVSPADGTSASTDPGRFDLSIDGTTSATAVGDEGTTGWKSVSAGTHSVGEVAASGTTASKYNSSIRCENEAGQLVASNASGTSLSGVTVDDAANSKVACTVTNTRKVGTLTVKKLVYAQPGDTGKFNLLIDGQVRASDVTSGGKVTTTINTGTHTVGESAGTGTNLADYSQSTVCRDAGGNTVSSNPVTVAEGADITCTITNSRDAQIRAIKRVVTPGLGETPGADPGKFDLKIATSGGTDVAQTTNIGDGGTTGWQSVNSGNFKVIETAGTNTNLSDYTTSINCDNATNSSASATSLNLISVGAGRNVTCTVTNTRKTGTLTVRKNVLPATGDPGRFNLKIGSQTYATDVGNNGTTGSKTLNTGTYTVSEVAGTGTDLKDYTSSITCRNGANTVVAGPADATSLDVAITSGSNITCTVTNTHKGEIKVVKQVVTNGIGETPAGDPGRFNLSIDGTSYATDVGHNGTTDWRQVTAGTHPVAETAGTSTNLDNYTSGISCNTSPATTSSTSSLASLTVAPGARITCTVTNTRKTGTLTVRKNVLPATGDPGRFNLKIGSQTYATDVGNNGTTGSKTLNTGTYTVSEVAGTGTDLKDYTSSITCRNGANTVVAGPADATSLDVAITSGSNITCTVTNTHKGEIKVVKQVVTNGIGETPAGDPGRFNLSIDGTSYATDVGHNGTTDWRQVTAGTHPVAETAGTSTNLDNYTSGISCNTSPATTSSTSSLASLTVAPGARITCTVTNTRKTGTLTVVKKVVTPLGVTPEPEALIGRFNLLIDGASYADRITNDGTTGAKTVGVGTHSISEAAALNTEGSLTNLDNYSRRIVCKDGSGATVAGPAVDTANLQVSVGAGSNITCTVTNSWKRGLRVVKRVVAPADGATPSTDDGRFDLLIDGVARETNIGDGGETVWYPISAGAHTVSEAAVTGTNLSNYDTDITCRSKDGTEISSSGTSKSVTVPEGDAVTCLITNTRKVGRIRVVKELLPDGEPGAFNLAIDGVTRRANAGDGDSTEWRTVNIGSHSVSESAGTGTNLDDYTSTITCRDGSNNVVAQASGTSLSAPVTAGSDVTCTITNTGKRASISGWAFEDAEINGEYDNNDIQLDKTEKNPRGMAVLDLDCDGLKDAGEPTSVVVNGRYNFTNLRKADYCIFLTSTTDTRPWASGHQPWPYYCETNARCRSIGTVAVWGENEGPPLAVINNDYFVLTGVQFVDTDRDGSDFEEGDQLLRGWTVFVDTNKNRRFDDTDPHSVTNNNGFYKIGRVPGGRWMLYSIPDQNDPVVRSAGKAASSSGIEERAAEGGEMSCTFPSTCAHELNVEPLIGGTEPQILDANFGVVNLRKKDFKVQAKTTCSRKTIDTYVTGPSGYIDYISFAIGKTKKVVRAADSRNRWYFSTSVKGLKTGPNSLAIRVHLIGTKKVFYLDSTVYLCPKASPVFTG